MKRLGLFVAVLLLTATMATTSFAYGRGGPGGFGGPGGDPAAWRGLNLTPEQSARIDALRTAYLKDTQALRDKVFSKRGDLRLLWLEKNPDAARIAAAQKELRALRDQQQDKRTAYILAVRNILTPEQQASFNSFCGGGGFGSGYGRGRGPGYAYNGPGSGMRCNW